MGTHRTTYPPQKTTNKTPWPKAYLESKLSGRNHFCTHVRHPLGNAATGNGLRQWHDLLATITRLAKSRCLENRPPYSPQQITPIRPNRFQPLCRGQRFAPCSRGGDATGPSPVDRRKPGSKHHILTDGHGIPIVAKTTAANRNDVTEILALVNDVPAIAGQRGFPRYRFESLYADRGYDSEPVREALRSIGTEPHIAYRGESHGSGLGVYRWVVERTLSWLHQFRRLRIRYERRLDIHEAFLTIGCVLICHRILENPFC